MNIAKSTGVVLLVNITIAEVVKVDVKLKQQRYFIKEEDFAEFIKRRSLKNDTENDTTGSNKPN